MVRHPANTAGALADVALGFGMKLARKLDLPISEADNRRE